jgi:hypothetical protein
MCMCQATRARQGSAVTAAIIKIAGLWRRLCGVSSTAGSAAVTVGQRRHGSPGARALAPVSDLFEVAALRLLYCAPAIAACQLQATRGAL